MNDIDRTPPIQQAFPADDDWDTAEPPSIGSRPGSTVVRSTTGTAPVTVTDRHDGTVRLDLEDGSSQVYERAELLAALGVTPAAGGFSSSVGLATLVAGATTTVRSSASRGMVPTPAEIPNVYSRSTWTCQYRLCGKPHPWSSWGAAVIAMEEHARTAPHPTEHEARGDWPVMFRIDFVPGGIPGVHYVNARVDEVVAP